MTKHLRVAIIGAGPAGIYAGNILKNQHPDVTIDLFDSLPAPYGLIRYGVAPDHPRIKGIVNSLHEMLAEGSIRFFGNVTFGRDLTIDDVREHYHAVIFATGAIKDAELNIPGIDLDGSHGAADFVSWYDGHPDYPRTWPLEAEQVAVLGNGNVALDVARVLAKHADDMLSTDIPANVYAGLKASPVTDVHVFGRRGPAQIKFTPIELRELGEINDVDIVVYEEDFPEGWFNEDAEGVTNQHRVMVRILNGWREEQAERAAARNSASRRLHLHFFASPVEILGAEGKVTGIKFERTALNPDGASVHGTGEFVEYSVGAVYRAIGYFGSELPDVPFDSKHGVIRNQGGRVVDESGAQQPGLYATGWIKRGPVGLIGHTKSDASETIENLLADADALADPTLGNTDALLAELTARGVEFTDWAGWLKLDAHERALGAADQSPVERERVKVVARDEQVRISRG
ncbi:MAG: FAD-dependent oxidoreductase [Actinomycetales bacterium]|nr:FAD-dependent oxidoreductase [Actinomycetales bacterium]